MKETKKEKPLSWLLCLGVILVVSAPIVSYTMNIYYPTIVLSRREDGSQGAWYDMSPNSFLVGFIPLLIGLAIIYLKLRKCPT